MTNDRKKPRLVTTTHETSVDQHVVTGQPSYTHKSPRELSQCNVWLLWTTTQFEQQQMSVMRIWSHLIKCAFARRAAHLVKCVDWPNAPNSETSKWRNVLLPP